MKTVHVERLQGRRFEVSEDAFGEFVVQLFEGRRVLDAACDFETIEAACERGHEMERAVAAEAAEAATCPACDGEGAPLGALGSLTYYRCRACGMDFSR
jgi:hypothetical protein